MIHDEIKKLYKKFDTYNPYEIAKMKDIDILTIDLDIESYGMTVSNSRCRTIIINGNIHPKLQEFTVAHELGHCVLHRELSTPFMRRTCAYSTISKLEAEAHRFAFTLLSKQYPGMRSMNKYQVIDLFNLPQFMERFMDQKDYEED